MHARVQACVRSMGVYRLALGDSRQTRAPNLQARRGAGRSRRSGSSRSKDCSAHGSRCTPDRNETAAVSRPDEAGWNAPEVCQSQAAPRALRLRSHARDIASGCSSDSRKGRRLAGGASPPTDGAASISDPLDHITSHQDQGQDQMSALARSQPNGITMMMSLLQLNHGAARLHGQSTQPMGPEISHNNCISRNSCSRLPMQAQTPLWCRREEADDAKP